MNKCIYMYDNKYKNKTSTNQTELDEFLILLADTNEKIDLFAIGGTAMILKNIKEATKDIDFFTEKDISSILKRIGLKELSKGSPHIWQFKDRRIDIFSKQIMGIPLNDNWKEKSEFIKSIGTVNLYILDWEDIIITKIARAENRDYDDIKNIITSQNLSLEKIKKRYYEIAETSLIADYDYKFKLLEKKL